MDKRERMGKRKNGRWKKKWRGKDFDRRIITSIHTRDWEKKKTGEQRLLSLYFQDP
jgi:mRNA-degrading endonuclease RelE of RelBE toxin-antitoxin system